MTGEQLDTVIAWLLLLAGYGLHALGLPTGDLLNL